jgi:prevent-host-death family protein
MAAVVNMHEAKTHFSKLIARVATGEQLIIAKAGHPVALLCPIPGESKTKPKRKPGFAKGLIPDSGALFDPALDQEIEDLFYGKNEPTDESANR